jgi:hypothetical protein
VNFKIKITFSILILLAPICFGQFYFGRNKIQYNKFDWHILKTEHFDIYYYPQMRNLAEIGAAQAEESYALLEHKFNYNVNRRIPLIFYATHAHFQETNTIPYMIPEGVGGFFEFLKGRVVIPANGSISQFKHVIQHELVHVFTHAKIGRIMKDHRLNNNPGLPLWFTEGIAEYWSEGWDSQAEMFIRDAVLNNYIFLPSRLYQISGSFLMYKEGQALLKYIAETFGEEKLLQLVENIWMSRQFSQVMKITIGKDYKDLDKDWYYALKKEKYPLLQENESARMTTIQLTEKGINIKPAFYRHEGEEKIVFLSNRIGYSNIYTQTIDYEKPEKSPKVIIEGERTEDFESFHLLSSNIDVNSSGQLAFVSKSGELDVLYLYDIYGKKMLDEFSFDNLVSIFSPSWHPTKNKIVFSGLAYSGQTDIYIYDLDKKNLARLTDDYFDDRDPIWSPDGRSIAFSSDRGQAGQFGFMNLFLYNTKNGLINYITHGEFSDQHPAWSPDGNYLAFVSDRNGTSNIWALKVNEKKDLLVSADASFTSPEKNSLNFSQVSALKEDFELKQITSFTTGAFDPEWTDNGHLIFSAFENLAFHLHILKNVGEIFKKEIVQDIDTFGPGLRNWAHNKLSGESGPSGVKYRAKYNLDVAQSQITQDPIFGTSGGMQLAISDMLGNYQYFFPLYNTARTKDEFLESFNFAVSRVDLSKRANFATGIYHFAGRFYNRYDFWFWERRYGGFGAVSYPLSKFQRIEASLNVRFSDKDWYFRNYRRKAILVSNFVSYIKDNSLWGPTGPIDGERINITVGNTMDVAHSNVSFVTTIADYRRYFRLSTSVAHAVRVWTQINHGKEATPFFMGGSWDLRGYRFWRIWGTKLAMVSNELRFPFIDRFIINFPFGGLAISSIRGAVFADVGNAWDTNLDHLLGSTGFGVRFRFGGILVLRFDVGRKFTLTNLEKFYQANNYDFENKWFTQFFFGWDF